MRIMQVVQVNFIDSFFSLPDYIQSVCWVSLVLLYTPILNQTKISGVGSEKRRTLQCRIREFSKCQSVKNAKDKNYGMV